MIPKLREKTAFRVIIFILCAALAAGSFCMFMLGEAKLTNLWTKSGNNMSFSEMDLISSGNFLESQTFRRNAESSVSNLYQIFTEFAGEDGQQIDSGERFENAFMEYAREIYDSIRYDIEDKLYSQPYTYAEYDENGFEIPPPPSPPIYELYGDHYYRWYGMNNWILEGLEIQFDERKVLENDTFHEKNGRLKNFDDEGVAEAFIALFPDQAKEMRARLAVVRRNIFDDMTKSLEGTLYFVSDGKRTVSNVELDAKGYPKDPDALRFQNAWVVLKNNELLSSPENLLSDRSVFHYTGYGAASCHIAWTDEYIQKQEVLFNEVRGINWFYFVVALAMFISSIVLLIISIVFTGRKRPAYENTRKLWMFDKIYVEFQLVFMIFIAIGAYAFFGLLVSSYYGSAIWVSSNGLYIAVVFLGGFVILALALWFLLSLVRIGKAGLFAERSLIGKLAKGPCKKLGETIKTGYDGRNPLAKTILLIVLLGVVTALLAGIAGVMIAFAPGVTLIFLFLLVVLLVVTLWFVSKWVKRYGNLRKGVEEISSGNLNYQIEIEEGGKNEFDRLSAMVNELGSAQNTAIQNELKNQRLKTDLISNVSHDLKTPLTSIITYTDLLKKEGLDSKDAEEYLNVIDEKGQRLQKLTEDLFDAAKASSGALNVRREKVDLLALLNQEIAEFNGSFADADLDLIIDAAKENYYVEADGQLLWRVIDNLLRNVQKYALAGTRVYIDLKETSSTRASFGGALLMTTLEIKNTSASKLNIPPEELMERFKRGDESRATEGSGLGLAIAKDLVRLQGGWFEVFIDGDLFKVCVMLPPYKDEANPEIGAEAEPETEV